VLFRSGLISVALESYRDQRQVTAPKTSPTVTAFWADSPVDDGELSVWQPMAVEEPDEGKVSGQALEAAWYDYAVRLYFQEGKVGSLMDSSAPDDLFIHSPLDYIWMLLLEPATRDVDRPLESESKNKLTDDERSELFDALRATLSVVEQISATIEYLEIDNDYSSFTINGGEWPIDMEVKNDDQLDYLVPFGHALCLDFRRCAAACGARESWWVFGVHIMLALKRIGAVPSNEVAPAVAEFVKMLPRELTELAVIYLCYAGDKAALKEFLAGLDYRSVRLDMDAPVWEDMEAQGELVLGDIVGDVVESGSEAILALRLLLLVGRIEDAMEYDGHIDDRGLTRDEEKELRKLRKVLRDEPRRWERPTD
jgi:hypothetical protein